MRAPRPGVQSQRGVAAGEAGDAPAAPAAPPAVGDDTLHRES